MLDWQIALRVFYASLFAFSALSKARHPARFVAGVREYALVPARLVPATAAVVVLAESVLATGLVVIPGPTPWVSTIAALAMFTVAQAWSIGRGQEHACYCFGGDEPLGLGSLSRTLALTLVALTAAVFGGRFEATGAADPTFLAVLAYAAAVVGAMGVASADAIRKRIRGGNREKV